MAQVYWSGALLDYEGRHYVTLRADVVGVEMSSAILDEYSSLWPFSPKRLERILAVMVSQMLEEVDTGSEQIDLIEIALRGEARIH